MSKSKSKIDFELEQPAEKEEKRVMPTEHLDLAPDYAHYGSLDSWSVDEAASLLCDVQPGELEGYLGFNRTRAARREEIPSADEEFVCDKCDQFLRCRRVIQRALTAGKLHACSGKGAKVFLSPRELLAWATGKPDASVSQKLIDALKRDGPQANLQGDSAATPPEVQYSTRLIAAMHEAIKQFGPAYDLGRSPTGAAIVDWIKEHCDVSKHEAKMIDAMIRPDPIKRGGRKKEQSNRKKRKNT